MKVQPLLPCLLAEPLEAVASCLGRTGTAAHPLLSEEASLFLFLSSAKRQALAYQSTLKLGAPGLPVPQEQALTSPGFPTHLPP